MQTKISAFFRHSTPKIAESSRLLCDVDEVTVLPEGKSQEIVVTYKRRIPVTTSKRSDEDESEKFDLQMEEMNTDPDWEPNNYSVISPVKKSVGKILNKKRNYAQYHLELGQSDFLLHSCSTCGVKYARGDETDEKVHMEFHKRYCQGIKFKGWLNERVVSVPQANGDHIVLVLDDDPPYQKLKVQEVVNMMEKDLVLSDGWLLHKLCKVYLFISSQCIVGALVAEPIRRAHRVISISESRSSAERTCTKTIKSGFTISNDSVATDSTSNPSPLQFGSVSFQREVVKKLPARNCPELIERGDIRAVICEKEAVSVLCGIRAIWVVPSCRRKLIATRLLDVLRKTVCKGFVLEPSQCAFSQLTSAGSALASSYCKTDSFLVYYPGTQKC